VTENEKNKILLDAHRKEFLAECRSIEMTADEANGSLRDFEADALAYAAGAE
jgi:hypothetical protein